jgi:trans-aconitate methyltransferase
MNERIKELAEQAGMTPLQAAKAEIEALNQRIDVWEKTYEAVCDERDAIIKDADKAHALLRWVEKEMRYACWDIRLKDQHGRTDVYEAIKEFLS